MYSPTSWSLLPTPLGSRDLFTTGPGPDSGGSKPGQNGWTQMPEKFGVAAAPCAPSFVCPKAGVAATSNVASKKKSLFMPTLAEF